MAASPCRVHRSEDRRSKKKISSKQFVINFLCVRETRPWLTVEDDVLNTNLENDSQQTWTTIMKVLLKIFECFDNHPEGNVAALNEVECALQKEFETSISVREGTKWIYLRYLQSLSESICRVHKVHP